MTGANQQDGLDSDFRDQLVAIGKGVAGLVPIAGGTVAEIVGAIIPEQRADRIATYLRALASRVDELTVEVRTALAANPESIDLIEEGGFQAARATSSQRIEQIVEAVSNGLRADDADVIRRKRLLLLLGELDDDEINILNAYGRAYGGLDRDAFANINLPDPAHLQSSVEVIDQNQLYQAGRKHLLRLGLLKKNYGSVKKGQLPEFDAREGDFKHRVEVSYLGRMVLREIGLGSPFDAEK